MSPQLVAGLVTGGCALVVPVITFVLTKAYEGRFFEPMARSRREALAGKWRGRLDQAPISGDLEVELDVASKRVHGKAHLTLDFEGKERFITLSLTGGFLHDQFLKLDYKNTNPGTIQFGSIILELAAEPRTMEGEYAGYGSLNRRIVSGKIMLTKREA